MWCSLQGKRGSDTRGQAARTKKKDSVGHQQASLPKEREDAQRAADVG